MSSPGAIGSQRKLDATFVSESVETSEFLESSTKLYGVPLLMSDTFYQLLDSSNRYRCRKVDQLLLIQNADTEVADHREMLDMGEKMDIYTFDMVCVLVSEMIHIPPLATVAISFSPPCQCFKRTSMHFGGTKPLMTITRQRTTASEATAEHDIPLSIGGRCSAHAEVPLQGEKYRRIVRIHPSRPA